MEDEMDESNYSETEKQSLNTFHHQPITAMHCNIVHAITGEVTPYKMGTKDEYLFYVIMDSDPDNPKDPRRLYFSSPYEYEHHTGNKVPLQCIQRFKQNRLRYS
jgi:hypothetical protein